MLSRSPSANLSIFLPPAPCPTGPKEQRSIVQKHLETLPALRSQLLLPVARKARLI